MLGNSHKLGFPLSQPVIVLTAGVILFVALFFSLAISDAGTALAQNSTLIFDNFTDRDNTSLSAHIPSIAPEGHAWREARGSWKIEGNKANETLGFDPDARLVIDANESDVIVRTKIIWNGGFAGVVFRYLDEDNWIMAWFDGARDVVLGKKVDGIFSEVARTSFDWGRSGRQRQFEVVAIGNDVIVSVSGEQLLNDTISELSGNTSAGLFSRNSTENRFGDFRVRSASQLGEPISTPEPGGPIVSDEFNDDENTKLVFHSPDVAPEGSSWEEAGGAWFIEPKIFEDEDDDEEEFESGLANQLTETTGANRDNRVVIEAGNPNVSIQAEITWRVGFVGLVARYLDEDNWIMAWFDGAKDVVIGKKIDGVFKEVKRTRFRWGGSEDARKFQVSTINEAVVVSVDNRIVLAANVHELNENTKVGIFSRNAAGSAFDNFQVIARAAR